jgi:hypothetical protein
MNDLKLPGDDERNKSNVSQGRIAVWVIVGGIGLYMVLSGVFGIVSEL